MGTIVVGYVPKPEGHAALRRAAEEARLRDARLVVVNSHRGGREFDRDDALESQEELERSAASCARPASSTRSASWCAAWTRPTTWSTSPPRCGASSS